MTFPRHMMATKAAHKMGNLSRDKEDLCLIEREDGADYIGAWVAGYGFFDVRFPKDSTRDLTDAEAEHYGNRAVQISGYPPVPLKVLR